MSKRPKLKRAVPCILLAFLALPLISAHAFGSGSMPSFAQVQLTNSPDQQPEAVLQEEQSPATNETEITSEPETASERELNAQRLDELFAELAKVGNPEWKQIQDRIWEVWAQSGSPSMDLLLQRANQAMRTRDTETAMLHLNDLVRLAPDFAEGWNMRATVLYLRGEFDASIADIRRTLQLEPRHFGALSGLGSILDRLGDEEGALLAYRQVLEIHPNLETAREAVKRLSLESDGREL